MNKDKKNTSKLFYWNLTYKEKFQRTLIVLPFLIMAIIYNECEPPNILRQ